MVEIPNQLKNEGFRFIKLRPKEKIPIEKKWQEENNYPFDNEGLLKWIAEGGNYGVCGGFGNLVIIDSDSEGVLKDIEENLPRTFSVRTKKGKHFYYICKDLDKPIRLSENVAGDRGDVQWTGKFVVGAGSVHPSGIVYAVEDDIPIVEIKAEQIKFALRDFLVISKENELEAVFEGTLTNEVDIRKVINVGKLTQRGDEYYGAHPIHGSEGGANFWVNPTKGTWHCFRHETGGGALSWIAVAEGIIDCSQAVPGALAGESFVKTLKAAKEKYGLADEMEKQEKLKAMENFKESYESLLLIFKRYLDLDEKYYSFLAIWTLGAFFHDVFITYPYLFLNAQKGSGKSRLLKLCGYLLDGTYTVNLTEAVLFRRNNPLFIDEVENINKKEKSGLRELLNVAYKKGGTVERVKKIERTGEMVIDSFPVFRSIGLANIEGLDDVLEDRCLKIILEKSFNKEITRRLEMFDLDQEIQKTKIQCRLCRSVCARDYTLTLNNLFYALLTTLNNTHTLITLNDTNHTKLILDKIEKTELLGRDLELWLPLFVVASYVNEEVLNKTVALAEENAKDRALQNTMENRDIILINFLYQNNSNFTDGEFAPISKIVHQYKEENSDEEWFNSRWVGRALIRLNLITDKRRVSGGREVVLNKAKIKEKAVKFGLVQGQMKVSS